MILNGNRGIPKNFVTVRQLIEIDIDKPEARPITVGSLNFVMLTKYFLMDASCDLYVLVHALFERI